MNHRYGNKIERSKKNGGLNFPAAFHPSIAQYETTAHMRKRIKTDTKFISFD